MVSKARPVTRKDYRTLRRFRRRWNYIKLKTVDIPRSYLPPRQMDGKLVRAAHFYLVLSRAAQCQPFLLTLEIAWDRDQLNPDEMVITGYTSTPIIVLGQVAQIRLAVHSMFLVLLVLTAYHQINHILPAQASRPRIETGSAWVPTLLATIPIAKPGFIVSTSPFMVL